MDDLFVVRCTCVEKQTYGSYFSRAQAEHTVRSIVWAHDDDCQPRIDRYTFAERGAPEPKTLTFDGTKLSPGK